MIERLLAPLTAALVLAAAVQAQEVRLSVESGRALLVTDHGVSPITRTHGVPPVSGPGHLELAPGSRASLRWAGRCSIELRGPVSVAWQPPTGNEGLRLDFSALREADVEVRNGALRIGLPGAWRARLEEGAYSLYGLPAGGVELVHRAGREARATWVGGEGFAPPPVPIRAGDRARLQGQPDVQVRGDASSSAPEWGTSTWPWGSGGIPDQPDLALRQAPGWDATSPWPWTAEEEEEVEPWRRWDWPWQPPGEESEVEPASHAGDLEPTTPDAPGGARSPGDLEGSAPGFDAESSTDRNAATGLDPTGAEGADVDVDVDSGGSSETKPEETSEDIVVANPDANAEANGAADAGVNARPNTNTEDGSPVAEGDPRSLSTARNAPRGPSLSRQAPERVVARQEPAPWGDFEWPWETRDPVPSIPGMAAAQPSAPTANRPADQHARDPLFGDPTPAEPAGGQTSDAPDRPASAAADTPGETTPEASGLDDEGAAAGETPPEPVPLDLRWEREEDPLPPPSAYYADHWRGLPEGAIEFHPNHAIQVGPPYEFRTLKDGSRELWLPPTSTEPLWYFSPNLDLRLFPGASLVLEQDGSIRYHRGTVRLLTADPARRF